MFQIIAFDADDTLWENEVLYLRAKAQYREILSGYLDSQQIDSHLDELETRNVEIYGYGIKSFTLSMLEAALTLTDGQIKGGDVQRILGLGRDMLSTQVQLFEHTERTLDTLARQWELMLLTKGDTFEQSRKIARTGLGRYFRHIEIVGDKSAATYQVLFTKYTIDPRRFLMIGNSLKSDILPVVELGGQAIYIPYEHTWQHEHVPERAIPDGRYTVIEHIGQLPEALDRLQKTASSG